MDDIPFRWQWVAYSQSHRWSSRIQPGDKTWGVTRITTLCLMWSHLRGIKSTFDIQYWMHHNCDISRDTQRLVLYISILKGRSKSQSVISYHDLLWWLYEIMLHYDLYLDQINGIAFQCPWEPLCIIRNNKKKLYPVAKANVSIIKQWRLLHISMLVILIDVFPL